MGIWLRTTSISWSVRRHWSRKRMDHRYNGRHTTVTTVDSSFPHKPFASVASVTSYPNISTATAFRTCTMRRIDPIYLHVWKRIR